MPLTFRYDHRALGINFFGIEDAVDHPVCFQSQRQIDLLGGHGFEIGGPIDKGESIPHTTLAGDGLIKHTAWKLRRALELHVLNPM